MSSIRVFNLKEMHTLVKPNSGHIYIKNTLTKL